LISWLSCRSGPDHRKGFPGSEEALIKGHQLGKVTKNPVAEVKEMLIAEPLKTEEMLIK